MSLLVGIFIKTFLKFLESVNVWEQMLKKVLHLFQKLISIQDNNLRKFVSLTCDSKVTEFNREKLGTLSFYGDNNYNAKNWALFKKLKNL